MKHDIIYFNQIDLRKREAEQRYRDMRDAIIFGAFLTVQAVIILYTTLHSI